MATNDNEIMEIEDSIDDTLPENFKPPTRARSNTLPVGFLVLPEIKVEDFSDDEALSDTYDDELDEDVCYEPPIPCRKRANTCPENIFHRPVDDRPPTPPPSAATRFLSPKRSRFVFQQHRLKKVSEDKLDPPGIFKHNLGNVAQRCDVISERQNVSFLNAKRNSDISYSDIRDVNRLVNVDDIRKKMSSMAPF